MTRWRRHLRGVRMWVRVIDATFDVRTDARGRDPDLTSPTLRRYHRLLWSKPLPCGMPIHVGHCDPSPLLAPYSELGEFSLASDGGMPRYPHWFVMAPITSQVPDSENQKLLTAGYTIGGRIIWPRNKVDGKITINGARGMHPKIKNRFDLTVECVRRHYLGVPSPLGRTMARYPEFFALFENFRGYVDFFLLQDLVTDDYSGGQVPSAVRRLPYAGHAQGCRQLHELLPCGHRVRHCTEPAA